MNRRREQGFALLVVLATLGPLTLLVSHLVAAGRTEVRLATSLRASVVAQTAADGAIHLAVLRLLQGRWPADGAEHVLRVEGGEIHIRIENQASRVNPNLTTVGNMQALLAGVGVDTVRAKALARAIMDWRSNNAMSLAGGSKLAPYRAAGLSYAPTNRPFESIDEIGLVLGMTPEVLARLRPLLSIYRVDDAVPSNLQTPDAVQQVDPLPMEADTAPAAARPDLVVLITANCVTPEARFTREAVVRLNTRPAQGQRPFHILTWDMPLN